MPCWYSVADRTTIEHQACTCGLADSNVVVVEAAVVVGADVVVDTIDVVVSANELGLAVDGTYEAA